MNRKFKKYIKLALLFILFGGNHAWVQAQQPALSPNKADSLVNFALTLQGTPYRYAGTSPKEGFDCSGFVYYVFKHFDIPVPRVSRSFAKEGLPIEKSDCQKGDIILFTGSNPKKRTIGHVGIVISEKGAPIEFVHASSYKSRDGIVTNLLNSGKYTERFVTIRRVEKLMKDTP